MILADLHGSRHQRHASQVSFFFFFFNDTATTEIYTLSLHDALPISAVAERIHPPLERRHGGSTGDRGKERGGVAGPPEILGDIRRVITREAGRTEVSRNAPRGPQHAVQREIAERGQADVIADLCDDVA